MKKLPPKVENAYKRLLPYLTALFFTSGFFFDVVTLGRIDNILNILSHGAYLLAVIFILRNQIVGAAAPPHAHRGILLFFEYQNELLHFLLGALLNAFVIFYFKSGSVANTFVLLMILAVLLIANELQIFKKQGPALKVALIVISLVSYFIYLVPVTLGKTGTGIFALSVFCACVVLAGFWYYLFRKQIDRRKIYKNLVIPAGCVLLGFVLLYALKIIPPIPLSLKHLGIYHAMEVSGDQYILYRQTPNWRFWSKGDQEFVARPGDRIYLFAKIFSPGGFKGKVFLHFQYHLRNGEWKTSDRIPMNIVGGRADGFRGHAYKQNYDQGEWRAKVETENGLEIGRISFTVTLSDEKEERKFYTELH
ncbi:MAG: DUF2914 domain-containing protein [Proteobacteria bacterium]|nr:DUF2914 domain-containing protein [Pseudomonadota bacterium]